MRPDLFGIYQPLSRAGLVTMVHRDFCEPPPEAPPMFTDVDAGAFYAVAWAAGHGIMSGTSDTEFDPDGATTLAQRVTVLWRALGERSADAETPFTDVVAGAFYQPALEGAVASNLVAGTTPTTFGPHEPLNSLDATELLYLLESTINPAVT